MGTQTLDAPEEDILEKILEERQIILYNDPVNTFEHVIDCLVKYCKHESMQAEQCAIIVHHSGKCSVKKGKYKSLEPICSALLQHGLTAEIE